MENTTAVVFGDFIQFHKEEIIEDGANDYIVAHELFHHWFGDLVTCESWANLTLTKALPTMPNTCGRNTSTTVNGQIYPGLMN